MHQPGPSLSGSPSFHSSDPLAQIAARVVHQLSLHDDSYDDVFYEQHYSSLPDQIEDEDKLNDVVEEDTYLNAERNDVVPGEGKLNDVVEEDTDLTVERNDVVDGESKFSDDESEFEFDVLCNGDDSSPVTADEIFYNGQIRPVFPIFNSDLVSGSGDDWHPFRQQISDQSGRTSQNPATIRLPLRKLLEERETTSCSSSETDDLDGIPTGTYCVWTPKQRRDEMKKKSNSTGSSKRWRLRDLVHRSNSDGRENFVFLTPNHRHNRQETAVTGGAKEKRRGEGGERKKKTYLPYRRDLVGFFASVNGLSRTIRPI